MHSTCKVSAESRMLLKQPSLVETKQTSLSKTIHIIKFTFRITIKTSQTSFQIIPVVKLAISLKTKIKMESLASLVPRRHSMATRVQQEYKTFRTDKTTTIKFPPRSGVGHTVKRALVAPKCSNSNSLTPV